MYRAYLKITFFSLAVLCGRAQDGNLIQLPLNVSDQGPQGGIYLTFADYKKNKLSYAADCKTEKKFIKLHEFFNESYITVKHKGKKIKLQKDSVYGILNCNEPLIRFQDNTHYSLAEKGPVWLFFREVNIPQSKGTKIEKKFYFSTKGDGKLVELTVDNIKKAFPENHKLHDLVDAEFQSREISEYDTYHKMFKINHLINTSINDCVCPMHSDIIGKEGDTCPRCGKKLQKN